ncbi:hypothetical protein WJ0W_001212 [Paenibacillus melissococcoides]|uniref:Uncharacterized protein n=1 Tax=Paenibacillus melissococcoides TaxID=2912268 RepID=A0ABM9FXN0_9BACL|nr:MULTISPECIES: hypothetical protein [Paenibacillus]MEB9893303.1 hypothetical protein [Bacillus cereus]CAH8243973.1 hypothetical protein WJ0W_001212 [Paenibacillus melissococcoides]CAH8704111.1 hypothetical protein HTL2_000446 [Paenibacillus melissococcoides]CAH8706826.1 hypothetical protein WDD9_001408 [Paenibacillus melissococcoides]GIO81075.1 hypothetical protein J6TS7_46850 [Paenibacillus dendritiformis]
MKQEQAIRIRGNYGCSRPNKNRLRVTRHLRAAHVASVELQGTISFPFRNIFNT